MLNSNNAALKELATNYAQYYSQKDTLKLSELLSDNAVLFDPEFKWIKGKENIIHIFQQFFDQNEHNRFEIVNNYQEKCTSILEFKVHLDTYIVCGVLFMEWDDNSKIRELRAYCNPQERYYTTR